MNFSRRTNGGCESWEVETSGLQFKVFSSSRAEFSLHAYFQLVTRNSSRKLDHPPPTPHPASFSSVDANLAPYGVMVSWSDISQPSNVVHFQQRDTWICDFCSTLSNPLSPSWLLFYGSLWYIVTPLHQKSQEVFGLPVECGDGTQAGVFLVVGCGISQCHARSWRMLPLVSFHFLVTMSW